MDNQREDNRSQQLRIYESLFHSAKIDHDDFLIPPHDFAREKYFRRLRPRPGERLLEIGIGLTPFLYRASREYGLNCYGLDFTQASLMSQSAAFPGALHLVRADGEHLPFPGGAFDHIVSISVIEHLTDYPAAFAEIRRVLKPGGRALIQMPCKDFRYSLFGKLKSHETLRDEPWFRDLKHSIGHDFDRIPTRQGWKDLIRGSGLKVEKAMAVDIVLDAFLMYYGFEWIKRAYSKAIRSKSGKRPSANPSGQGMPSASASGTGSRALSCIQVYSWKRKIIGFLWKRIFLEAYWRLSFPERLFPDRAIGASVYFELSKPD